MKTRSQSHRPRCSRTAAGKAKNKAVLPRLFLVTERGRSSSGNGWIIQADSPLDALQYFQLEILNSKALAPEDGWGLGQAGWVDYLELESRSGFPCFMQECLVGKKTYYIEALTLPNKRCAWIPASFN